MKHIIAFAVFLSLGLAAWAQLPVTVKHDGKDFQVDFPAVDGVEYRVVMVDPINPGELELQQGTLDAQSHSVKWTGEIKYVYELRYRVTQANGEYSQWYIIDPKAELDGE